MTTVLTTYVEASVVEAEVIAAVVRTKARVAAQSAAFCGDQSATVWFPVAPGVTQPAAPAPTTNASPAPPNSVALPPSFDATDTCFIFQDLLPLSTAPVYAEELEPTIILEPYSEIVPLLGITVASLSINEYPYPLTLPTGSLSLVTKAELDITASAIQLAEGTVELVVKTKLEIDDGSVSAQFSLLTYTGTEAVNNVTGAGFKPGLVWIKDINTDYNTPPNPDNYYLFDKLRGTTKYLSSNNNAAEGTDANSLTTFDADGFSLGTSTKGNISIVNYVAMAWKEGGAAASNTDGTITSSVSYNSNLKMSVITYTGNGTGGATIGHGLGVTPDFIMIKRVSTGGHFIIGSPLIGGNKFLTFDPSFPGTYTNSAYFRSASSSTITLGDDVAVNANAGTYVIYAFTKNTGVSDIGTYVGNDTTKTVSFGFQPQFVIIMGATYATGPIAFYPTSGTTGPAQMLYINYNDPAYLEDDVAITATGLTILGPASYIGSTSGAYNADTETYFYAAFA